MARVVGDGQLVEETDAQMQAFFKEPGRIHYVMMCMRPGVNDCLQTLEHTHYKPRTPRNDLFQMRFVIWGDINWFIVSIPEDEKHFMEKAAAANGLKVADGIPTLLGGGTVRQFPVKGRNVFTLENVPGHPVYKQGIR